MTDSHEDEYQALLEGLLGGLELDSQMDVEEFLAQHPEHADRSRSRFEALRAHGLVGVDSATAIERGGQALGSGVDDFPEAGPRYRVVDELGSGGMGVVVRAWDGDLQREVAMKVVREDSRRRTRGSDTPSWLARFLREARVTGQLEHPNIVPVHELGRREDGTVFFTMKLVEGETLDQMLRAASRPLDPTRATHIVQRICDALSFAHSRGVIHRDLKPQNVMVGRFGEVQVMDWGLAKVLGEPDSNEVGAASPIGSPLAAQRADSPSVEGEVFGTPTYMSPEQARGELGKISERTDVFGVGAVLYHLLTGRPPLEGASRTELARKAAAGDRVLDWSSRVWPGSVPRELKAVCRRAMRSEPEDRYPTARALADDLQAYLDGRAGLAWRDGPAIAAVKWVRRHPVATIAFTATVLVGAVGKAGFDRRVEAADAREQVARAERAERERRAVEELFELRAAADSWSSYQTIDHVDVAGRMVRELGSLGIALEPAGAAESAAKLRELAVRDPGVCRATLDAMYELDRQLALIGARSGSERPQSMPASPERASWAREARATLLDLLARAETNPWRRERWSEWAPGLDLQDPASRIGLSQLGSVAPSGVSGEDLTWAALVLRRSVGRSAVVDLLTGAVRASPDSFWAHVYLAMGLWRSEPELALEHATIAVALHPNATVGHSLRGGLLMNAGRDEEALDSYRIAFRRDPSAPSRRIDLAQALSKFDRREEALELADQEISLFPGRPGGWMIRAELRAEFGDLAGALEDADVALDRDPLSGAVHVLKGELLFLSHDAQGAVDELRLAVLLSPGFPPAHRNLARRLLGSNRPEEALAHALESSCLTPHFALAHASLAYVRTRLGDHDGAVESGRRAVELEPLNPDTWQALGLAFEAAGRMSEAFEAYEQLVVLAPDHPWGRNNRGNALLYLGRPREALRDLEFAVEQDSSDPLKRTNLSKALRRLGRAEEAAEEFARAAELYLARMQRGRPSEGDMIELVEVRQRSGDLQGALEAVDWLIARYPSGRSYLSRGNLLRDLGDIEGAADAMQRAIELSPDFAEAHCNLGWRLLQLGDADGALESMTTGHRLGSSRETWIYPSDIWVRQVQGLREHADVVYGEREPRDVRELVWKAVGANRMRDWGILAGLADTLSDDLADPTVLAELTADGSLTPWYVCEMMGYSRLRDVQNVDRDRVAAQEAIAWYRRALAHRWADGDPSNLSGHVTEIRILLTTPEFEAFHLLSEDAPWADRAQRLSRELQVTLDAWQQDLTQR